MQPSMVLDFFEKFLNMVLDFFDNFYAFDMKA